MSIQVSWLIDGQVVYFRSSGVDTISDVLDAEEQVVRLFDESDTPLVHIIFDFSEVKELAQLDLKEDRNILKHPKNGWNIFVAMNDPLLKMLAAVKGGQQKSRLRWFVTLMEAAEFLQSVDSSLPDLTAVIEDLEGNE